MLIRLDAKKDRREAPHTSITASIFTGATAQTGNTNVVPLLVTRISDSNNLVIVPVTDLPPGEYLLMTGPFNAYGYSGYDFGVK